MPHYNKKRITVIFRCNEMPRNIFTMNYQSLIWTTVEPDIAEMLLNLDQHIPQLIWQNKKHHQDEHNHGILQWKTAAIFWEKCSGVSLRASLLQARDGTWFPRNEILKNAALQAKAYQVWKTTIVKKTSSKHTR